MYARIKINQLGEFIVNCSDKHLDVLGLAQRLALNSASFDRLGLSVTVLEINSNSACLDGSDSAEKKRQSDLINLAHAVLSKLSQGIN